MIQGVYDIIFPTENAPEARQHKKTRQLLGASLLHGLYHCHPHELLQHTRAISQPR